MIESSTLMKKAFEALHRNALTIIAYAKQKNDINDYNIIFIFLFSSISLALIHILFFSIMAMFLFPRSDVNNTNNI